MSNKVQYLKVKPVPSIKAMLKAAVDEAGDKVAYRFFEGDTIRDVTYRAFREQTLALGQALRARGLSGEHIAISSENSYDWIVVYLTVLQSNGVFVPIDKELPENDFMTVLLDSESKVVFYNKKHEAMLTRHMEGLDHIRLFVGIDCEGKGERFTTLAKLIAEGEALRAEGKCDFENEGRPLEDLAMLVYTSGTTGAAKGVMLSEKNLCASVYYGLHVSRIFDVGLSVLPYHHTYEAVPGLLVAIHCHVTLCINENLKTVVKSLNAFHPEHVYLVPAFVEVFYKKIWASVEKQGKTAGFKFLIGLSNFLRKLGIDLRRKLFKQVLDSFGGELKLIVCGGAPFRPELGEFFEAIGIEIFNGYGITECSPLVSVNSIFINDYATVGTPLPCCEIKLEGQTEEGDGEICVRGPNVMMGYYKRPDLTAEVLESDGWFHTGDYGRINKKGQLMITGRKKNLIVLTNGKNVFPEELEGYLQSIPYVQEVVVYGIKNEAGQEEALGAEYFLSQEKLTEMGITDAEGQLKKDTQAALAHLPSYKHISRIYIRDVEFVKNSSNKIKRVSLISDK